MCLSKLFTGRVLGREELLRLAKKTLRDEFIPNPGNWCNYNESKGWLAVLRFFEDDLEIINEYLPKVAEVHKAKFRAPQRQRPVYRWCAPISAIDRNGGLLHPTYGLLSFALSTRSLKSAALVLRSIKDAATLEGLHPKLFGRVLKKIKTLFDTNEIEFSAHPAFSHFFQCMAMKHFLPKLGTPPVPTVRDSLQLPPLSCDNTQCSQCDAISMFLTSVHEERRTWELTSPDYGHVRRAVRGRYLKIEGGQPTQEGKVVLTLTKQGLSYKDRLADYHETRGWIKKGLNLKLLVGSGCFGDGPWEQRIVDALRRDGTGYTDVLKAQGVSLLLEEFPVADAPVVADARVVADAPVAAGQKRSLADTEGSSQPQLEPPQKKNKLTILDLVSSDEETSEEEISEEEISEEEY